MVLFYRKCHSAKIVFPMSTGSTRLAGGKTSVDIKDIIPASVDGRVETLFIQKGKDLYGIYDREKRNIIVSESAKTYHASLYNMATVHTLQNGGLVFLAEPGEMPVKDTEINALFRY